MNSYKKEQLGCGKIAMKVWCNEYIDIKCGEEFSGKLRLCQDCRLKKEKSKLEETK